MAAGRHLVKLRSRLLPVKLLLVVQLAQGRVGAAAGTTAASAAAGGAQLRAPLQLGVILGGGASQGARLQAFAGPGLLGGQGLGKLCSQVRDCGPPPCCSAGLSHHSLPGHRPARAAQAPARPFAEAAAPGPELALAAGVSVDWIGPAWGEQGALDTSLLAAC